MICVDTGAGWSMETCVSAPESSRTLRLKTGSSDEGIGISSKDQQHLFGRFSRAPASESRRIPGIGLGLYVSRELARLHGGDIQVESTPGRGSTFWFSLPHRAGQAAG